MNMKEGPRKVALKVISRCEKDGGYSTLVFDSIIKGTDLQDRDIALASRIAFGVISRKITLDYYISQLSNVAGSKIEPLVRNALRIGLYQLMFMDRIPPHAAVNESVTLVPKRASGFVNAVLQNYIRKKDSIKLPSDEIERLSVIGSCPIELCEKLTAEYGYTKACEIIDAYNEIPKLTLRTNTLKTDRNSLSSKLLENGIVTETVDGAPFALMTENNGVTGFFGYGEGLFYVQDVSSQILCASLGVKPGDLFLDCCSAPGSKSFGAAMYMENKGKIVSFDLHENKLSLIRSSAQRLGIDIISAECADARVFIPEYERKADVVLCDVPCSGYGVVAKKPEIRYKSLKEASNLPTIQYAILENCSKYVRDGGYLVYSTCTVLPEENRMIAEKFMNEHKDFAPAELEGSSDNTIQLLPSSRGNDGFFIAKFKRIG